MNMQTAQDINGLVPCTECGIKCLKMAITVFGDSQVCSECWTEDVEDDDSADQPYEGEI